MAMELQSTRNGHGDALDVTELVLARDHRVLDSRESRGMDAHDASPARRFYFKNEEAGVDSNVPR